MTSTARASSSSSAPPNAIGSVRTGPRFPRKIERLPVQAIVEIGKFAEAFPDVVPLWFGESGLATPKPIIEAANRAAISGATFYPNVYGTSELRSAIANYASSLHNTDIAPSRTLVTASGMEALSVALQSVVADGDHLVIIRPCWQNLIGIVERLGAEVCELPLIRDSCNNWSLPVSEIVRSTTEATKAIVVNSPNNPTGWVMKPAEHRQLLEFARSRGIWLIMDEVYERLSLTSNVAPSMLDFAHPDDPVIVINSFSKAWAMTGWRLGWIVAPERCIDVLGIVKEYSSSGTNPFVQSGGCAALRDGEEFVDFFRTYCRHGLEIVQNTLGAEKSITLPVPEATFYAIFKAEGIPGGIETCRKLVAEHGVGIAPCDAFGGGLDDWFRICFAQSPDKLQKGLQRLVKGLRALRSVS